MLVQAFAACSLAAATLAAALPVVDQVPLFEGTLQWSASKDEAYTATFGGSHLSEWCALSKQHFLADLKKNKAQEWIIVMGNEAGDLDSLVSAIALAYDLAHTKHNQQKAVALLQVENSAIDLRPENKLALENSRMERGHKDLLVLEELPYPPQKVGSMIQGLMLVDHNRPLSYWGNTPVLGIVDQDRGVNTSANPRLIDEAGSASSLVTSIVLDHRHSHGPLPRSLGDLILSSIAIDTKGLEKGRPVDHTAAEAIFRFSHSAEEEDFRGFMTKLGKQLKKAKKALGHLDVWQLIQRDWKGDVVLDSAIPIHLGFASIPYSFQQLIDKTPNKTIENFWAIEDDWAHYNQVDIAIMLTSYKNEEGEKRREIIMTVKSGHRIDSNEAERLFNDVKRDVEASEDLKLTPWNNGQELPQWRYAWTHNREDGGRKIVRPLVEKAVQHW